MDGNVSIQRVPLRDLEPNPYRLIKRHLYDHEKLHRLQASYTESGFWDGSIHARPHPTKPRKYQLAFGHHRIKAAELAGMDAVGVVIAPRDNATMIRMMASENAEEFKHSPLVTQETIGAVIEAYGRGEIELERVGERGPRRYETIAGARVYSLLTVARFLGWVQRDGAPTRACRIAFDAWHADRDLGIDVRCLVRELQRDPDAPEAVTNRAVESILIAASSARDQATHAKAPPEMIKRATRAAAKAAMNAIVDKGSGFGTTTRATYVGKETANRMLRLCGLRTDAKVQNITDLIVKTVDRLIDRSLLFLADIQERLMDALPYRDQIPDEVITNLVRVLRKQAKAVHDTLMRLADEWEHQETKNVTPTIKKLAPGEGHSTSERRT